MATLVRDFGIVAYLFFTAAILCGTLYAFVRRAHGWRPWVLSELHQFLTLLAWLLVLAHIVALLLDPASPFSLANVVQPFVEPPNRPAAPWAVIATYLVTIIALSSWLRRYIPALLWRKLHTLAYIAFVAMTIHGILAGSDTSTPWMNVVYGVAIAVIPLLILFRVVFFSEEVVV